MWRPSLVNRRSHRRSPEIEEPARANHPRLNRKRHDGVFPFPKDFYFLLLRVHANYRRPVSAKETQTALLRLASKLESHGFETEKIASKLAEITPYSLRTVERRLPAK